MFLWDIQTGVTLPLQLEDNARHVDQVSVLTYCYVAFRPDGKRLVSANSAGVIHLWDMQTGKRIRTIILDERTVNYPSLKTWACAKRIPSVHSTR